MEFGAMASNLEFSFVIDQTVCVIFEMGLVARTVFKVERSAFEIEIFNPRTRVLSSCTLGRDWKFAPTVLYFAVFLFLVFI